MKLLFIRFLLIPPSLFIACFIAICHCEIYRKLVPFKLTNNEEDHDTERSKGKRYRCRALKQSAIRFIEIISYIKNKTPGQRRLTELLMRRNSYRRLLHRLKSQNHLKSIVANGNLFGRSVKSTFYSIIFRFYYILC